MARSTHIIQWRYGTLNTHHTLKIRHAQHTSYSEDMARSTHIILTHNILQPVADRTSHLPEILLDPAAPLVLCACLWHDRHYQDCKVLDPHWATNRKKNPRSSCSLHNALINNGQPITVLQSGNVIRHKQQNHMHLIFKFSWDFQVSLTTYHGFIKLPHHFKCVAKVTTWLGLSQFVTHRSAKKHISLYPLQNLP